jgi:hypothetical protein
VDRPGVGGGVSWLRNGIETKSRNEKNTTTADMVNHGFLEEVMAMTWTEPDAFVV